MFKHLILIVLLFSTLSYSFEIPAHVKLSFKTSTTLEKNFCPLIYAAQFVFSMEKQIFNTLDGEWDTTVCDTNACNIDSCKKATELSSFDLSDLKITSHQLLNLDDYDRISVKLGYKEKISDTSTVLMFSEIVTASQFFNGNYSLAKTGAFSVFSDALETDILTEKCSRNTRRFNNVYFTIEVIFTTVPYPHLDDLKRFDVNLELKADAETTVTF